MVKILCQLIQLEDSLGKSLSTYRILRNKMLAAVAVEDIGYPLFEIYGTRALAFGTS